MNLQRRYPSGVSFCVNHNSGYMSKSLKQFRQRAFEAGNFRKYAFFYVGEVVLIVAGIVIALQIDNWNEARKDREEFKQILSTVVEDLKTDERDLEFLIPLNERKVELMDSIITNQVNLMALQNCMKCFTLNLNYHTLTIRNKGNEKLKNLVLKGDLKKESLVPRITNFYLGYIALFDDLNSILAEDVIETTKFYRDHVADFKDILDADKWNPGLAQSLIKDGNFFSRLAFYNTIVKTNTLPQLKAFRDENKRLQEAIAERLE